MSPGIPLTPSTFTAKYAARFPDQQFELVVPADFRELAADTAATFLTAPAARALFSAGKVLSYSAATGAFTLPAASAVQSGYLTAADYIAFAAKQVALGFQPENVANRGTANGYAPLDSASLIPAVYLPSYVDGIAEYATFSAFPAVGLTGKIYLADDDLDGQWRWSPTSSTYRKFNSSIGTTDNLVEGATNRYFTTARVLASTLAGYAVATVNTALAAGDSLLVALGKLEKRISDNTTAIANLAPVKTINGTAPDAKGNYALTPGPTSTDGLAEGTTNKYFTTARVLASTLAGYAVATVNTALAAGDSLLVALGKLEKKISDNTTALPSKFTNRGAFVANIVYATNDVIVQAGNAYFRQGANFTPTAFVAGDWVAYSTPQFTADQVATFLASASPVLILPSSGAPIGYNTLDAALAVPNRVQPISAILNVGQFTIQVSNPTRGYANWPAYFDARGATIVVNDGITLTVSGGFQYSCVIANIFWVGQTANTGIVAIPCLGPVPTTAATAAQLINCYSTIPVQLNSSAVTLVNGYFKSLTGTGTVYLYGAVQVDSIASTLTVVDRRPGASAPATATATTTGVVKGGPNIALDANGSLSVGGVHRGAWVAINPALYKQNDEVINPAGQLVTANLDHLSGATYTSANWTLVPGQSSNDYTAPEKSQLAANTAAIGAETTARQAADAGLQTSITANTAAIALKANKADIIAAANNLTTSTVSNVTPPTIDAVNGALNGFALQYIGPPANGNIQIGRPYGTLTLPADAQYCVFENGANGTFGAANAQIYIGAATIGTTVGDGTSYLTIGRTCGSIVIGANVTTATIGSGSSGVTIGDSCTSISVGEINVTVTVGNSALNCVVGNQCNTISIGASAASISVGPACRNITINPSCVGISIGQSSSNVTIGGATAALKSGGVDLSPFSRSVTVNLGQQQLRLIGCNFFTAPAGSNRTYLANLLVACTNVVDKGTYANGTAYNPNNRVSYLGQAYLANAAFTSGTNFDATVWTAYFPANGIPARDIYSTLSYDATLGIDFANTTIQTVALSAAIAFGASINITVGMKKRVVISNPTGGPLPVTLNSGWHSSVSGPISVPAGKTVYLDFQVVTGTTETDIFVIPTVFL